MKHIKIIQIITLSLLFFTCNIFETRDPESPSQTRSNFLPPSTSAIVLSNLGNAISEKNSLNYIQCLSGNDGTSNSFTFIPAPEVQTRYLSIFMSWDINSEKSYFENLISQTSKTAASSLTLNGSFILNQSDSVVYNADYVLSFNHEMKSIPQICKGNLQFAMHRDKNNNWCIAKWMDNKINNEFCWSELKASFSN
jgi:hypothetical protein